MRKALVVGIDNYQNSPLQGSVNDALSISEVLEENGDGSPNFGINLITSGVKPLKKSILKEQIKILFEDECEKALFYFSGHGFIDSSGGYIVTSDYENNDVGVEMNYILELANTSPAKDKIIILDCCYSGSMGIQSLYKNNVTSVAEGVSILTASRSKQVAIESNECGVFTSLVVDGLKGGAADIRGFVTPGSIYAYVDQALGPWDQRPIFKTNVSRFTSMRTIEPQVSKTTLRNIIRYFPTPDFELALDPTYEHTSKEVSPKKSLIFKDLQQFEGIGLVVPVGEEHMYYAAVNSKSCKLTVLGHQVWRLASKKRI